MVLCRGRSAGYRNDRAKYVEGFWKVVHWDFAAKCFAAAAK